ncbi:MAG: hypothetical protein KHZ90_08315 [Veillonella parvula]|uniref:Uncharacterized protein n=1 Tax=Veillonella parvula TaxID=29466 RepID=A0A942WVM1_VEIPA|nr:hypothetical protein [Veillonella parvula]MBS4893764.1 hypothetical protein [Veillonella parvula]
MKKLVCLLGHNKYLMKIKDCNKENFKNENRAISVYTCKYCGKDILVVTKYVKLKVIK